MGMHKVIGFVVSLFFSKKSSQILIKRYIQIRNISKELNSKIIKNGFNRNIIMKAAGLLGIAGKNDSVTFASEAESDVLTDFVIYERISGSRSVVETYQEKIVGINNIEKIILEAFTSSYTSLFKIIAVSEPEKTLLISDILNKKDNLKLIDINFSETSKPGMLLFTRLVPFNKFNMTSGISFIFPDSQEKYLINKHRTTGRMDHKKLFKKSR